MSQNIALPAPKIEDDFMKALSQRRSSRTFEDKEIPIETLSELLWAAYGNTGKKEEVLPNGYPYRKTVPVTGDGYVYRDTFFVFTKKAVYRYDADSSTLVFVKEGDFTELTGFQDFIKNGSVNIVLIADYKYLKEHPLEFAKKNYAFDDRCRKAATADAGYISQNIYLYCALHGLKTIARFAAGKEEALLNLLGLNGDYHLVLSQTIGY
ncbi:Nitroreductase [Neocallimastix californiae]|uniref:Nitroreductase n=1 Tax=Neocallimastix californiae TaxID=1754190 RepID=A0A1Y2FCN7_9FUNG|nr:Nitroreductase [Neocallimastix californiae]|eukprot:ORY81689.1 Nitroreductase [Neocallimastix californiae]